MQTTDWHLKLKQTQVNIETLHLPNDISLQSHSGSSFKTPNKPADFLIFDFAKLITLVNKFLASERTSRSEAKFIILLISRINCKNSNFNYQLLDDLSITTLTVLLILRSNILKLNSILI